MCVCVCTRSIALKSGKDRHFRWLPYGKGRQVVFPVWMSNATVYWVMGVERRGLTIVFDHIIGLLVKPLQ